MLHTKIIALSLLSLTSLLAIAACSSDNHANYSSEMRGRFAQANEADLGPWRGWDYLANKLLASGIPEKEVKAVILDTRFPAYTDIPFKLKPRETSQMYEQLTSEARIKVGTAFLKDYAATFAAAEKAFHVNRYTVAAIITVESSCGQNTGREMILYRLARVSSVGSQRNLEFNLNELRKNDPNVTLEEVQARAQYLEKTFYPEVLALFEMQQRRNVDVLDIKGSFAGAFGLPQFLPSAYLAYGIDGNKDGAISLFSPEDAIWSAARYLSAHGWKDSAPLHQKMQVLWAYNHSEPYGQAIMKVSIILRENIRKEALAAAKHTQHKKKHK